MPAPTITTLALSSTANPPYVSRRRERNARATQGEQEARSTSGEDLPCPRRHTPAHWLLLRTTHRFPINGTTNIRSLVSQAPSPAFRAVPGALSKVHRAGSTDHQLVTRPLFALRAYSIIARELSALNRGRRAAARSTSSRLGLPPFCLSSERKGVEVPPISLKTTCLRSPLSRFVPTRRPGPRPSGRPAPGRVSRRRSRGRPRGRRLCSSDRRRAHRRFPA